MATSRIADSVGRVLGDRYRLTRPLGVGASAHVFAAEDVQLRRRVAVKVLHPALAGDDAFLRRFRAEARAVASLRHPNIVRVYDWGEDSGSPFLVMELLEGGSLRALLDSGARLSVPQAVSIGAAAAHALDHAHRQGLFHRDVKPANLIFDDEGRVSVADFGLARALAEATWTEPAGAVVGTARYAAPELVGGDHLDGKADVYALAIVLVEAITGRVPFAADTAIGTLMARVGRPLEVPEELGLLKPVLEAAGRPGQVERLDAGGLARALDTLAERIPPPATLPLARPLEAGVVERDDTDPTEYPGRPRLYDAAASGADGEGSAGRAKVPPSAPPLVVPPKRRRVRRAAVIASATVLLAAGGGAAWVVESGWLKPEHRVPTLVGRSRTAAVAELGHLHLRLVVRATSYSSHFPSGEVITQTPSRGKLKEGSAVFVVLSRGPQPVPVRSLAGLTKEAAEQVLATLGLKWTVKQETSMTVPADQVISSDPSSGTLLPGQSVALSVSTGKPQVPVPALTPTDSASFAAARAALSAAGLGATEQDQYSDTVAKGQVIAFQPSSGTQVTVGTPVTVQISKGPHLVQVPNVEQQSVGSATQAIDSAGLSVSGVQGNPLGTVVSTTPGPGAEVHIGSSVALVTG